MRFIAAQFDAYFENGLWLTLATHANQMAQKLSIGLASIDGVKVWYPTQINEVFVAFPDGVAERLREQGYVFYPWITPGDPADGKMQRLICSFKTSEDEVKNFLNAVGALIR